MTTRANATFQIKNWDEKTYEEIGDPLKLTRASVSCVYQGDIEGESKLEYLMAYSTDGASFVGLEHLVGRIGGRSGSCVLQYTGTFETPGVKATFFVVPGCGTDELRNLKGEGRYELVGQHDSYQITLDYDFA